MALVQPRQRRITADDSREDDSPSQDQMSTGSDSDFEMEAEPAVKKKRPNLRCTVLDTIDACNLGPRMGSKILSAFSATLGGNIFTRSATQRALDKSRREKLAAVDARATSCTAVFCDGRNDRVCVQTAAARTEVVHNISVNMHPDDISIGHFACEGSHTARAVAEQLVNFLSERGVRIADAHFVGGGGADGTTSVVGWNGGMMAELEKLLPKPSC